MRKLSLLLLGCIFASALILSMEALALPSPGGIPVPAWYTYPKVKRLPWGKNMERIVVYNDGSDEVTTRDSADPATPPTSGEGPVETSEPKPPPCNCAQCSGNRIRRQKYVTLPAQAMTTGKKPRFFGLGYPYVDDYYEEYDHGYYGGGGYPYDYGGGFGGWGMGGGGYPYGGGGGYPYGGGMGMGMGGYWK